jgi:hypothetical protein
MVDQVTLEVSQCPSWAAALGYGGVAAAVCLSNWGSAVSLGQAWRLISHLNQNTTVVKQVKDWCSEMGIEDSLALSVKSFICWIFLWILTRIVSFSFTYHLAKLSLLLSVRNLEIRN